jgi:hypothetical protein
MKKISSLIVCLALLAVGTAFALELPDALKIPGLTVTGDVMTGLRVSGGTFDDFGKDGVFNVKDDDGNYREPGAQDPTVSAYSNTHGNGAPFRAQLLLVWEREKLGVKTLFRYQPAGPGAGLITTDPKTGKESVAPATQDGRLAGTLNNLNLTIPTAYVYANLLDNKIKVSLGKATDKAWALPTHSYGDEAYGNAGTNALDNKDGIKVEVKPIEGLNVGAHYGTSNLFAKAVTSSGYTDQTQELNAKTGLDITDRLLVVGAKYTSSLFSVVATTAHNFVESQYKDSVVSNYTGGAYDALQNVGRPIPSTSNLLVGVQVAPIDPLTIDLSVAAINLGSKTAIGAYNGGEEVSGYYKKGDFNPFWAIYPNLTVAYKISEQLTASLGISDIQIADAYYTAETGAGISNDDKEGYGLGFLFPITITPAVLYAINNDISVGLDISFKINANGSDQLGFVFKPTATFALGSGATFVVYDELALYTKSNDDTAFIEKHQNAAGAGPLGGASGTTNTLQFDFVWKF